MSARRVLSLHRAVRDDIADLITRRPLPAPNLDQIDPFLLLNHHGPQTYPPHNGGLPFGPHPHRGFETVTFILDGSLAHHDSASGENVVGPGGVQWMTAGRGLVHAEVSPEDFKREGGRLEILQLWVNLPSKMKMTEPNYVDALIEDMPPVELASGVTVRWVSGAIGAPIRSLTEVALAIVDFVPGASASLDAPSDRNVLLYVIHGAARIGDANVPDYHLAKLGDGDRIEITSVEGCKLLFGHADPIGEPVAAHGPFVMNTRQEIAQAVADYQNGRFL